MVQSWLSYRTEDDKYRKPKEIFPKTSDIFKNPELWKKRRMNYLGDEKFFDQEVRTGICYFCNREGRPNKSEKTVLHHAKYDHRDPLAWTIEVCGSCHWQIDQKNRERIAKSTGKVIERRYGKYDGPYYENKEQKRKRAERDKADWYMRYCSNNGGKFEPIISLIPDRETFDKVVEAIKNAAHKKAFPKGESMSDVSHRYF